MTVDELIKLWREYREEALRAAGTSDYDGKM